MPGGTGDRDSRAGSLGPPKERLPGSMAISCASNLVDTFQVPKSVMAMANFGTGNYQLAGTKPKKQSKAARHAESDTDSGEELVSRDPTDLLDYVNGLAANHTQGVVPVWKTQALQAESQHAGAQQVRRHTQMHFAPSPLPPESPPTAPKPLSSRLSSDAQVAPEKPGPSSKQDLSSESRPSNGGRFRPSLAGHVSSTGASSSQLAYGSVMHSAQRASYSGAGHIQPGSASPVTAAPSSFDATTDRPSYQGSLAERRATELSRRMAQMCGSMGLTPEAQGDLLNHLNRPSAGMVLPYSMSGITKASASVSGASIGDQVPMSAPAPQYGRRSQAGGSASLSAAQAPSAGFMPSLAGSQRSSHDATATSSSSGYMPSTRKESGNGSGTADRAQTRLLLMQQAIEAGQTSAGMEASRASPGAAAGHSMAEGRSRPPVGDKQKGGGGSRWNI